MTKQNNEELLELFDKVPEPTKADWFNEDHQKIGYSLEIDLNVLNLHSITLYVDQVKDQVTDKGESVSMLLSQLSSTHGDDVDFDVFLDQLKADIELLGVTVSDKYDLIATEKQLPQELQAIGLILGYVLMDQNGD